MRIFGRTKKGHGARFVDSETLKNWVTDDVARIIEADPFLRDNLKMQDVSFKWYLKSKVVDDSFFAHLSGNVRKFSKIVDVNLHTLNRRALPSVSFDDVHSNTFPNTSRQQLGERLIPCSLGNKFGG
jgi:hypothetical protein